MAGLRGDLRSIARMKKTIRELPRTVAVDVARRAAPALTDLTRQAFDAGQSVYGEARPQGVDGKPLTLDRTGAVKAQLRFVQIGTVLRCALGPKYARYLIRYGILPNGALPSSWQRKLGDIVQATKVET